MFDGGDRLRFTRRMLMLLAAALMGIIEGLTEFLPISSTGHLIIFGPLLGFDEKSLGSGRADAFEIFIQLGAIVAVVIYFRVRLLGAFRSAFATGNICETAGAERQLAKSTPNKTRARRFLLGIFIATLPSIVVALVAHKFIEKLPPPSFVAWVLIGGGALLWAADQWRPRPRVGEAEDLGWGAIIFIGCAQTLAMLLPGFSRSGATIIAALVAGASNKAAAEFSFFLSIPTMFLACTYALFKHRHDLVSDDIAIFAVGFLSAFITAFLVVKGFLLFLQRHSFKVFAYYRVAFGAAVLFIGRFF